MAVNNATQTGSTIKNLYGMLREPIKQTFRNQSFTVCGDVESVNRFENDYGIKWYVRLNDQGQAITVVVPDTVMKAYALPITKQMHLAVTGTITVGQSELQLLVFEIESSGDSRISEQLIMWEKKYRVLIERTKRNPPRFCANIAVISNEDILGYGDFAAHLEYGSVRVWNTKMQGQYVAVNAARAIKEINERTAQENYDCICILRGGGSEFDLFEFSKPALLEAIGQSKIPVLTAIGHESDNPLCDSVADMYFSTPTALGNYLSDNANVFYRAVQHLDKEICICYEKLKTEKKKQDYNTKRVIGVVILVCLLYVVLDYISR